jgi:hypothetical protein
VADYSDDFLGTVVERGEASLATGEGCATCKGVNTCCGGIYWVDGAEVESGKLG